MNEQERTELARLKEQQARLENELRLLSQQLRSFEQRITQGQAQQVRIPEQASQAAPGALGAGPAISQAARPTDVAQRPHEIPPPVPPVIPLPRAIQAASQSIAATQKAPADSTPQPPTQVAATTQTAPQQGMWVPSTSLKLRVENGPKTDSSSGNVSPIPVPPPLIRPPEVPTQARSFEMRLGTYWLVRIGIVMVLTGLVFFGNLAYQNYISRLGPGGKISLLYLTSALLLTAGWWWQRKAVKETLKNYAQVLFAGGLAALYFTTYAAHHIEPLQIIQSPLFDGVLLLVCAGFMIWAAERKKSEVLAFFAVGLAYYTSIITHVGYFTLWSNLVLSASAVFFLVRNRWAALSFGSLVATYAAYGFWRFFDGTNWHWASPSEGLWSGTAFLMMYWLVFTTAVFLSRQKGFAGENRAGFLTLNNGAFFTLFLLTMLQVQQGGFWKFALVYGAILVGLAALAEYLLAEEPLTANAYLTQGLLLVTVGFISKFAGLQLALILALESVFLLIVGQQRKNLILLTGAYIAAGLAVGWGMDGLKQFDTRGLWLGIGLGVMMMVNAFLTHRQLAGTDARRENATSTLLRPQPSYFTVLALAIWTVVTWDNTNRDIFPLVLAAESVLLTFSIYALRVQEVTLLSQGLMLLAQAAWFSNWLDRSPSLPWWNPMLFIALNLALSHWWPRQNIIQPKAQTGILWQALYALGINLVLYLWLSPKDNTPMWLFTTSLLAVGLTIYGVATRAWFVAACAQLFLAVSIAQFCLQLWQATPPWRFPLAPIAALCLLSFGTVQWFKRRPDSDPRVREPLLQIALIYRWVALVMSIAWICEYVPARERIWILALLGLWVFLWAGLRRSQEGLLFSAAFTTTALALFWLPLIEAPTVYVPNLLVILVLLTQRQIARRLPDRYPLDTGIHNAVILIGGLSLWLFVSRWVLEIASGFYLTASWSVLALALFTAGLVLRERMYRWVGLGVLACALGRVVVFDVWKLETVYRILSFMALGIVLLVLGFIYSKYQEKIKEWL
jgi:uncharacterized membrane protein